MSTAVIETEPRRTWREGLAAWVRSKMTYALCTLWGESRRFRPGIVTVCCSCLLIALQFGLLEGLFSISSLPVDETRADLWIGSPDVPSVDLGRAMPSSTEYYLNIPGIERVEPYIQAFAYWSKPTGGAQLCLVIGTRLSDDALGTLNLLHKNKDLRSALSEPGAVVVDSKEFQRLGVKGVGDTGEINGKRVRIVGVVQGYKSLAGPWVFCSLETAQHLVRMSSDQTTFLLAKCSSPAAAENIAAELKARYDLTDGEKDRLKKSLGTMEAEELKNRWKLQAYTSTGFSQATKWHWLRTTMAGLAMGCAAVLSLLAGSYITYQTLSAVILSQLREYAVLQAMGIPRWRMSLSVLEQSFWVGLIGVVLALPLILGVEALINLVAGKVVRVDLLWTSIAVGTCLLMALISGFLSLGALRKIEPVVLLR